MLVKVMLQYHWVVRDSSSQTIVCNELTLETFYKSRSISRSSATSYRQVVSK